MIERKSVVCEFKTDKGKPGRFKALFSVTGNVDLDGDRIKSGAFEEAVKNDPNPAVVWTHMWNIPPIGETIGWGEIDKGAEAEADLFLKDHEVAAQVWKGLETKALKQFSFAFQIGEHSFSEPGDGEKTPRYDGKIREIVKIPNVFEWGPTLVGANPQTEMLAGKNLGKLLGLGDLFEEVKTPALDVSAVMAAIEKGSLSREDLLKALGDEAAPEDLPSEGDVATLMMHRPMLHLHS
jgi:HK97 family phage prohead protease